MVFGPPCLLADSWEGSLLNLEWVRSSHHFREVGKSSQLHRRIRHSIWFHTYLPRKRSKSAKKPFRVEKASFSLIWNKWKLRSWSLRILAESSLIYELLCYIQSFNTAFLCFAYYSWSHSSSFSTPISFTLSPQVPQMATHSFIPSLHCSKITFAESYEYIPLNFYPEIYALDF